jgi:2'-5' RNA ligase
MRYGRAVMHRLFVAIRLPRPARDRLLSVMGGIRTARWQTGDQLHLTLRFIGEVDRHLADDVHAALSEVRHPPFDIALSGLGSFERRGRPTTLWAGVSPREPLETLHHKIDQALRRAGVEPDRRAFHPHVTLARLKGGAGPIRPLIEAAGGIVSPPFTIAQFHLLESRLTPAGAAYEVVDSYSLG